MSLHVCLFMTDPLSGNVCYCIVGFSLLVAGTLLAGPELFFSDGSPANRSLDSFNGGLLRYWVNHFK